MPRPIETVERGNVLVTIWRGADNGLQVTIHLSDNHNSRSAWPCGTFGEDDLRDLMMAVKEAYAVAGPERAAAGSPGEPLRDGRRRWIRWRGRAGVPPNRIR